VPQSFTSLNYHLVFSTKHREPFISDAIANDLYGFIGKVLHDRGNRLIIAGGVCDHIHLLVDISKQRSLSETLPDIKSISSGWVHRRAPEFRGFSWQAGYGAFSVSQSQVESVKRYIRNQDEVHRTKSFEDEFIQLLDAHGLAYSKKYLWE
jgi:putative transposase